MLKTWREWWCYRCDDYEANDHSSRVCVYISTSVTQLDSFKETLGQFPVKFVAKKTQIFLTKGLNISSEIPDQIRYWKPEK